MTDNPPEDQLDQETRDLVRALFAKPRGAGIFAAPHDDTDTEETP